MININLIDYHKAVCFWLIFTRWACIIFQLPIFDNVSVPVLVKTLFTLVISYAFFISLQGEVEKDIIYVGIEHFWILTIFYSGVGLLIGYLVNSLLGIFSSSGALINQQIGFSMLYYFDPNNSFQTSSFERLIKWTMVTIIISSGALLPIFKGVYQSFFSIHIYDIGKLQESPMFFIEMFKSIFLSALMLSSPLVFTNILITTILGIIARTVPQMNIIMVSFIVNIGLGLLIFVSNSNDFFYVAFQTYTKKLEEWFWLVS